VTVATAAAASLAARGCTARRQPPARPGNSNRHATGQDPETWRRL